jgi:cation-transporting ATPase E
VPFPLLPRHLTLVGTFSIGVPGFFLALASTTSLVRPGFLGRVLRFSVPAGAIAGVATWISYNLARARDGHEDLTLTEERTLATITLLGIGLVTLVVISRPLRLWKIGLAAGMAASYAVVMVVPFLHDWFELDLPDGGAWLPAAAVVAVAGALIVALPRLPRLRTT